MKEDKQRMKLAGMIANAEKRARHQGWEACFISCREVMIDYSNQDFEGASYKEVILSLVDILNMMKEKFIDPHVEPSLKPKFDFKKTILPFTRIDM